MSKRKGLSLDEKRERLLEIFHDSASVFSLKELEKLGPKHKGIVSQAVKDVLQSLVDDALVDTDKIGAGNFFWSFPSKAHVQSCNILAQLEAEESQLKESIAALEKEAKKLRVDRPDTDERKGMLDELNGLEEENARLKKEIEAYRANDPAVLEETRKEAKAALEAVNRWTDNTWSLKSYLTGTLYFEPSQVDHMLEINEKFDTVEMEL